MGCSEMAVDGVNVTQGSNGGGNPKKWERQSKFNSLRSSSPLTSSSEGRPANHRVLSKAQAAQIRKPRHETQEQ